MIRLIKLSAVASLMCRVAILLLLLYSLFLPDHHTLEKEIQFFAVWVIIYSFFHMFARLGLKQGLLFLALGFVIPAIAELYGTSTGHLFGEYYYTSKVQPQILGKVPFPTISYWRFALYGVYCWIWFVFGAQGITGFKKKLFAAIAGGLMLMCLDLSIDPVEIARGTWVWTKGGWYFGIPLQNFWGWFLTAFTVLFIFLLFGAEQRYRSRLRSSAWLYHFPVIDIFVEALIYMIFSIKLGKTITGIIGIVTLLPFALIAYRQYRLHFADNNNGSLLSEGAKHE